jgi:hypothetical protein
MEDSMENDVPADTPEDGMSEGDRKYAEIVFGTKNFLKHPYFIEWRRRLVEHKKKTEATKKKPHKHDVC